MPATIIGLGNYPLDVGSDGPYIHHEPCFGEIGGDGSVAFPPELIRTVAFIYLGRGEKRTPIGTAFFLAVVEGDDISTYLITCKHVVLPYMTGKGSLYVRLDRTDTQNIHYLTLPKQESQWLFHSDPAVDLAILPMTGDGAMATWAAYDANETLFTEARMQGYRFKPAAGADVTFIGMFRPYHGTTRNVPIFRFGKIALVTDDPLPGQYGDSQQYVLECQAYPGNSGAPLFIHTITNGLPVIWILGMIAGFHPDSAEFRDPSDNSVKAMSHSGISTAVPADRIWEVLYGGKAVAQRKEKFAVFKIGNRPVPAGVPVEDDGLTRADFETALRKVSRRTKPPSQSGEASS